MSDKVIRYDQETRTFYRGMEPLHTLRPLERSMLDYFLQQPDANLTKDDIIAHTWPAEAQLDGISDDALYQVVRSLRQKLSMNGGQEYIVSWRGRPGGYRFSNSGLQNGATAVNDIPFWIRLHTLLQAQVQTLQLLNQHVEQRLHLSAEMRPHEEKETIK